MFSLVHGMDNELIFTFTSHKHSTRVQDHYHTYKMSGLELHKLLIAMTHIWKWK